MHCKQFLVYFFSKKKFHKVIPTNLKKAVIICHFPILKSLKNFLHSLSILSFLFPKYKLWLAKAFFCGCYSFSKTISLRFLFLCCFLFISETHYLSKIPSSRSHQFITQKSFPDDVSQFYSFMKRWND